MQTWRLTFTEAVRLIRGGEKAGKEGVWTWLSVALRRAQDGHLDFHTAPELCMAVGEEGDYTAKHAYTLRMWLCMK